MRAQNSLLKSFQTLPKAEKLRRFSKLTDVECVALLYDWELWGRVNQFAPTPSSWLTWLVLAGRGFGKTRCGAEWVRSKVSTRAAGRIALIARDPAEARNVMVQGESGLLSIGTPWERPTYTPSLKKLEWRSGAKAFIYSSEDPEELRGPQHDLAWVDELFKFRAQEAVWDQLMLGLRLGKNPQACITSTPVPTKLLKQILISGSTVVTRGTTYDNLANLSPTFKTIIKKYEGTRLGRQELNAEVLDDVSGALWSSFMIESQRVIEAPQLSRIVVAIDPAATSGEDADETGIVVVGLGAGDGDGYVLEDASLKARPEQWAKVAVDLYHKYKADRIIGEANNGGEMIEAVLRTHDRSISYKAVHASRGKIARAEPISALYEQGRMHHVGLFAKLEDQMCSYHPLMPSKISPDRLDALVWGAHELFNPTSHQGLFDYYEREYKALQQGVAA